MLLEPKKTKLESLLGRPEPRDPQMSGRTPGAGGKGVEPVGGDLGESIPKGIDAGLGEALVKSKQLAFIPASLHGSTRVDSSVARSHRGLRPRNRPPRRQHACSSLAKKPILSHQQGIPHETV